VLKSVKMGHDFCQNHMGNDGIRSGSSTLF
jgi:hypothetical protein